MLTPAWQADARHEVQTQLGGGYGISEQSSSAGVALSAVTAPPQAQMRRVSHDEQLAIWRGALHALLYAL